MNTKNETDRTELEDKIIRYRSSARLTSDDLTQKRIAMLVSEIELVANAEASLKEFWLTVAERLTGNLFFPGFTPPGLRSATDLLVPVHNSKS